MSTNNSDESQKFYDYLISILKDLRGKAFEFEVLPSKFPFPPAHEGYPIFREGHCIAISKSVLASVFVTARKSFFSHPKGLEDCLHDDSSEKKDIVTSIFEASSVLLLFDPEHLTAANFRKRYLRSVKQRFFSADDEFHAQARNELIFIQSLLNSPLHRHTKSPTLWHHRRWVFTELSSCGHGLEDELAIVMAAAEKHPRNYYAWSYARSVVRISSAVTELKTSQDVVSEWCLKHPSDTSGWSFLLFILAAKRSTTGYCADRNVETVLQFGLRFNCFGEALWAFLRTIIASSQFLSETGRVSLRNEIRQIADEQQRDPGRGWSLASTKNKKLNTERAVRWIDQHWEDRVSEVT